MTPRVGLALVICGLLVLAGCKGRSPGRFETAVATEVKRRITVGGTSNRNPLPATAESIHTGQVNFSHYCMACHGLDGQNTGVPFAENMSPPPPSLNSKQVQHYSDGQLKWVIENGLFPSGMPAARNILNDDEMWSIVNYIRHLPPKGSLGEPPAYNGDLRARRLSLVRLAKKQPLINANHQRVFGGAGLQPCIQAAPGFRL